MKRPNQIVSQNDLSESLSKLHGNNSLVTAAYSKSAWLLAVDRIIMPQPVSVVCMYHNTKGDTTVLLQDEKDRDSMSVVSGRIKAGEEPFTAASRIFQEKLGVKVDGWATFGTINRTTILLRAFGTQVENCQANENGKAAVYVKSDGLAGALSNNSHLGWILMLAKNREVEHTDLSIPKHRL